MEMLLPSGRCCDRIGLAGIVLLGADGMLQPFAPESDRTVAVLSECQELLINVT